MEHHQANRGFLLFTGALAVVAFAGSACVASGSDEVAASTSGGAGPAHPAGGDGESPSAIEIVLPAEGATVDATFLVSVALREHELDQVKLLIDDIVVVPRNPGEAAFDVRRLLPGRFKVVSLPAGPHTLRVVVGDSTDLWEDSVAIDVREPDDGRAE